MIKSRASATNSKLKFTQEENETLLSFLEAHPELCDPRRSNCLHQNKRKKLWNEIAQQLNKDTSACKLRWKVVRDYYYRTKSRGKVPPMRLSFLEQFNSDQQHRTSAVLKTEVIEVHDAATHDSNDGCMSEKSIDFESISCGAAAASTMNGKKHTAITDRNNENNYEQPNNSFSHFLTDTISQADEVGQFFGSMAETTRNLPQHMQLKLKRSISKMVYDAEEEYMNEKQQKELQQCCQHKATATRCLSCGFELKHRSGYFLK